MTNEVSTDISIESRDGGRGRLVESRVVLIVFVVHHVDRPNP